MVAAPTPIRRTQQGRPAGPGTAFRRRRNIPLALGGALVVIICAVLFAAAWQQAGHRQPVLAVVRDVAVGHVITAADLQVAQVSVGGPVILVPASQELSVIGRPAAAPLVAGSLLAAGDVGTPQPVPGQVRLGVALKPGQYPPDLSPGQEVDVLTVPAAAGTASGTQQGNQAAALPVGTAIVLSVTAQAFQGGGITAELQAGQDAMPQIAAAAASGLITLATAPQGR
jgi:hypothetical protein